MVGGGWSHCIVYGASKINAVLWVHAKCLECEYNLPSNTSDSVHNVYFVFYSQITVLMGEQ